MGGDPTGVKHEPPYFLVEQPGRRCELDTAERRSATAGDRDNAVCLQEYHINQSIRSPLVRRTQRGDDNGGFCDLDDNISVNAIDHNPAPGQGPGLEGIKDAFRMFRSAFVNVRFTIDDMVAEDDRVACRLTMRATHTNEFLGVATTQRRVTQTGIDILRFANAKLVERWGQFDDLGLLRQLGVVSVPKQ